jgi:tetratricopeptide (TPR) repeat protein
MIALGVSAIIDVARRRADVLPVGLATMLGLLLVAIPTPGMPNGQDLSDHYAMLGIVAANSGNIAGTIESFKQAIADNLGNANGYYNLALALKNNGDYAGAEQNVRAALTHDAHYGDAHLLLGDILLHPNRPLDAAPEYISAGDTYPTNPLIWSNVAAAYGQAGNIDEAAKYADKSVAVDPNYEPGWKLKGNVAYARHDLNGAKADWMTAQKLQPNDPEIKHYLFILAKTH